MKRISLYISFILLVMIVFTSCESTDTNPRITENFGTNWKFKLGDMEDAQDPEMDDSDWRSLNVPHDWSIEGEFSSEHPATAGGGALPGGIGWYRKSFLLPFSEMDKNIFIDFDGIYQKSEVWINGHSLGIRPNGYISFRYDLTDYLNFGDKENVIAVKVDNSQQPNSRWYSGSGIYRNVWLIKTSPIHVDLWGTFITTPNVSNELARIQIQTTINSKSEQDVHIELKTSIFNPAGNLVGEVKNKKKIKPGFKSLLKQTLEIKHPDLWEIENPNLYKAITNIYADDILLDSYETSFGIRTFNFDSDNGFSLNGKSVKINGVCNHHDLGCLGAAVNKRAIERQLEILKEMGCNAIRTTHNPPAPELLDLCDQMGFIVMDEVFDMWKKKKSTYDYSMSWDEWHEKDLNDFILRDRNHPSIFIWSIGNEIQEQWDTAGIQMVRDLYHFTKKLDSTRPITTGNNPPSLENNLNKPMVLDLIGYNYAHKSYEDFHKVFPGQKFIATETASALATRGHYDMPSDSIRRWPVAWDKEFLDGNPDNTVSAYDHVSAPWGSTHEEVWKIIKRNKFLSGQFIWTGFDYLGEPTPYTWPSRSSYFGIIDLAGFPKDVYYMYQSEWTTRDVLHIFPHWNWTEGQEIDVWAYSNADEVELFLNEKSLGSKRKENDELHLMWRIPFQPGTLKAVSKTDGKTIQTKEIKTAGMPAKIKLSADRGSINADNSDLSFVTAEILDAENNPVAVADNLVQFKLEGPGKIIAVDNGNPVSHESFKASKRKAFNGKCLVVIQSNEESGIIKLTATSESLEKQEITIETLFNAN